MPDESLKSRTRAAMDVLAMKPADLARKSSSTTATISNWLNGNVDPEHVKAAQLFRIADALQVDGRWLLSGEFRGMGVKDSSGHYPASHPVKSEILTIAIQLVAEELASRNLELPPHKQSEATKLAYDLLEEGLPKAKVLRFVFAAVA